MGRERGFERRPRGWGEGSTLCMAVLAATYSSAHPAVSSCAHSTISYLLQPLAVLLSLPLSASLAAPAEGSGYFIASTAVRKIFKALDRYTSAGKAIPDVSKAHALMLDYFKIADKEGMLEVFYKTFQKAHVAGFTRVLAEGETARMQGRREWSSAAEGQCLSNVNRPLQQRWCYLPNFPLLLSILFSFPTSVLPHSPSTCSRHSR